MAVLAFPICFSSETRMISKAPSTTSVTIGIGDLDKMVSYEESEQVAHGDNVGLTVRAKFNDEIGRKNICIISHECFKSRNLLDYT